MFTTYSLSLSFFEAFLLPRLEAVGCSDIAILVDEAHYAASLSERQASMPGKGYRLLPISCKSPGVFHSKVSYLWGEDFDLIAVSSGNLTYAGHGANFECLDFALGTREQGIFVDFADFVDAMLERKSIGLGEASRLLGRFRDRARRIGGSQSRDIDRSALIHSVRESIGAQLIRRLNAAGQVRSVLCASPYHHPAGKSLIDLAKGLGARRVDVCLDPSGLRAPYKLDVFRSSKLRGRFVVPNHKENRPLHAKWYEFRGQQNFLLTGSVNATHQALWTTDNVEAAILRPISSREGGAWVEQDAKRVESPSFHRAERRFDGMVVATLSADGSLEGELRGIGKAEGYWQGELLTMLGRTQMGSLSVDSKGRFVASGIPDTVQDSESAVQIRLQRGDAVAAGWVSISVYLEEASDTRGARLSLNRLARGEAIQGDVERIVHWLVGIIEGHAGNHRSGPPQHPGVAQDRTSGSRLLSFEDWSSGTPATNTLSTSIPSLFRRALEVLAKGRELGTRNNGPMVGLRPNIHEETDLSDKPPPPDEEYDLVEELIHLIDRVLDKQPSIPIGVELAFFKAEHRLRSAMWSDTQDAFIARCMDWIRWVATIHFPQQRRGLLEPVLVAMGACVAGMTPSSGIAAQLADLRDRLQRYLGRWSREELRTLATRGFENLIFESLTPKHREGLISNVDHIWQARTVREELTEFIQLIRVRERAAPSATVQQAIGPAVLKAILERAHDRCKFGEVKDPSSAFRCPCPGCGHALDDTERTELRWRRAVRCRGCGRAILWLG